MYESPSFPILQDLTGISNKNGTYNQEPYLHIKYLPLIFFSPLHLVKKHSWWRVFPSLLAPILYMQAQTHLAPKCFFSRVHDGVRHGLGAGSRYNRRTLAFSSILQCRPSRMLHMERLRRSKVSVKAGCVATWCWHLYTHLFVCYLALTAACTLQDLIADRLAGHCRSLLLLSPLLIWPEQAQPLILCHCPSTVGTYTCGSQLNSLFSW